MTREQAVQAPISIQLGYGEVPSMIKVLYRTTKKPVDDENLTPYPDGTYLFGKAYNLHNKNLPKNTDFNHLIKKAFTRLLDDLDENQGLENIVSFEPLARNKNNIFYGSVG